MCRQAFRERAADIGFKKYQLILGKPAEAALGVHHFMKADENAPEYSQGVAAIENEVPESLRYEIKRHAGPAKLRIGFARTEI